MGRGLSDLQQTILRLALAGSREPGRSHHHGADVFYAEVFADHFGWKPRGYGRAVNLRESPGSPIFSPEDIGRAVYDSANASVSRAFRRLEDRGLINRVEAYRSHWSGGNLTEQGRAVAESLNGYVGGNSSSDITDSVRSGHPSP